MGRFTGGGQVGAGAPPTTLVYTRLDSHIAVGTEASYKFTPASPLLASDFSDIVTVIAIRPTATLALRARYNSVTTADFNTSGARVIAGVETLIGLANQTNGWEILDSAINPTGGEASCVVHFPPQDTNTNRFTCWASSAGFDGGGWMGGWSHPPPSEAEDFESIEIIATASTWAIGTKIDTYGVRRT